MELRKKVLTTCIAASEVLGKVWACAEEAAEAGGEGSWGAKRASGGVPVRMLHSLKNASSVPTISSSE